LLRHPRAVSPLADLAQGSFRPVLDDPLDLDPDSVRRAIVCSGKIFYALEAGRAERDWGGIAILRLEQVYPFPADELRAALRRYPRASDVVWAQEEPANQGAWDFVEWRIQALLRAGQRVRYVGRKAAASPATGSHKVHQSEEAAIVEVALKRPADTREREAPAPAEVKGLREPASRS
jgi:2-oxoglutarate dehydrogenase E1 component